MCPVRNDPGSPTMSSNGNFGEKPLEFQEACSGKRSSLKSSCCHINGNVKSSDGDLQGEQDLERASASRKLQRVLGICFVFMVLEIVGGTLAGSLAMLSEAAHLLSDVAGFAISLLALRASQWSATPQHTYGYLRLEVLGALISVQSIWIMTGFIVYEAIQRVYLQTHLVDGRLMCVVATLGVCVNLVMIFLLGHGHDHAEGSCQRHSHFSFHNHEHFKLDLQNEPGLSHQQRVAHHEEEHIGCEGGVHHHDHHHYDMEKPVMTRVQKFATTVEIPLASEAGEEMVSLVTVANEDEPCHSEIHIHTAHVECRNKENININVRGAYLHALGDLIQSTGVLVTGIVIWIKPEWQLIDLLCSFLFSIVVMSTTFKMVRDVLRILMESTPQDVDVEAVKKGLLGIQGVVAVDKLHIWALTSGTNVLTCHLHIKSGAGGSEPKDILHSATQFCTIQQKIKHVTIQLEDTPL